MTAPTRRWSFSLRTMFVGVALSAIPMTWVGYQLNWMRERRKAIDERKILFVIFPNGDPDGNPTTPTPWSLRLFGEKPTWSAAYTYALSDAEFNRVQSLFPELKFPNEPKDAPVAPGPPSD